MCRNSKYIYNQYIHKSLLVSCGKCDACLQQKANARANRIRNHGSEGSLCLFLTLTYDNKYVPYIKKDDLLAARTVNDSRTLGVLSVPVYRDYTVRSYLGKDYTSRLYKPICSITDTSFSDFTFIPYLTKKRNCMGVIYYDDVQNFIKRLRINLKRDLNYNEKITYYAVGEYGGKKYRPHFHLLVYFPKGTEETLRPYIIKSWPFGDMSRSRKRIQTAINAASYVAGYVNKSADLPKVLQVDSIRQKHSHSFHFGTDVHCFSLPAILEKVKRGDCSYSREVVKDDVPVLVDVPYPNYVISRYFPKPKGNYLFTDCEISQLLLNPAAYRSKFLTDIGTPLEYHQLVVRLNHAFQYYQSVFPDKNIFDYCIDFCSVWRCRKFYIFKHSFDHITSIYDFKDFYENINDYIFGVVDAPTLDVLDIRILEIDPNARPDIVGRDMNLISIKNKVDTIRRTNSLILSELYDDL